MLYEKVYNYILDNRLIAPGTRVIAAVSGGADSVCLLDVLYNLADRLEITLECAHFNHNLRGAESDADEAYVRSLCRDMKIKLHVGSADVAALADGCSIEDAARRARYGFFDGISKNAVIATAHTGNDNVETFFINLCRGSGTRGLCGIPKIRGNIVRPLLDVSRDEIIGHLKERGLDYRTDSTNADTAYLRNFIRLDILRRLSSRSDIDIYGAVTRALSNIGADNELLDSLARQHDTDDAEQLSRLPDPILRRVLTYKTEKEFGIILDSNRFNAVKSLLCRNNSKEQLKGDIFAVNERGRLSFKRLPKTEFSPVLLHSGENNVRGRRILIKTAKEIYKGLTKACIDCDKIDNGILYADVRRDGDRFYCMGRNCTSSLKKLLVNDKLSASEKSGLTVIRNSAGDVVFVEKYGADRRFAPDSESKNIINVKII